MAERKQPTAEEVRDMRIANARKTIENKFFQEVVGVNQVKSNPYAYGELGLQGADGSYSGIIGSEDFNKARTKLYSQAKAKGQSLGVFTCLSR